MAHDGHDHNHGHSHAHPAGANMQVGPGRRPVRMPGFSLLRASLVERLALASGISLGIWGGVFWAIG